MTLEFRRRCAGALRNVFCLASLCWLVACGSNVRLDPLPPVENRGPGSGASAPSAAQPLPTAQSRVATVDLARPNGAPGSASGLAPLGGDAGANAAALAAAQARVIYFDYDSYSVRDEYQPLIAAQATRLNGDRNRRLQLEGHTDARGGSEYNLALGQRRADAVARSLALLGVQDKQLEVVSYGKERPAVSGSDEAAWAKNRRVELKDR